MLGGRRAKKIKNKKKSEDNEVSVFYRGDGQTSCYHAFV